MDFNPQAAYDLLLVLSIILSVFCGFAIGAFTKQKVLLRKKEHELRELIKKERDARELAEEAIRARDEFLSITSHELKTPLTTIILRIQSTLDSILNQSLANFSGEKLVASLNIAYQQTNRLQLLIKDLLNFSLITTGKLELDLKESDLSIITKETIDRFSDHLVLANCELKFEAKEPILGLWDQIRIEQAISNLLTNAIKYGEGSPILVIVKKNGNFAQIIISDKGIGIEANHQELIFDRFKRGFKDNTRFQGLGVGLFIVKQIVLAHGGRITLKSKLGEGSTFTIELPIKHLPAVAQLPSAPQVTQS